jgi:uncharacterized protein (DUF1778 family)
MFDPKPEDHDDEFAWTRTTEKLELSREALEKMQQLIDNPPEPSERLRAAARRCWQRVQK